MIQRLVPNARVGIGHGQMDGKTRKLMLAFMNGEFDVLSITTIIESGLMFECQYDFHLMPIILGCLICIKCEDEWGVNKKAFVILFAALFSHDR
jgi:hypothetical protein